MQINPIAHAAWCGLNAPGTAHRDYLALLAIQALVLLIWWPKSSLYYTLAAGSTPSTLFAVMLCLTLTLGYSTMRLGAEETLLPQQPSLLEWNAVRELSTTQIVLGLLQAHLLVVVFRLLLSAPLVAMSLSITPGSIGALVLIFANLILFCLSLSIVSAVVYLHIGVYATICYLGQRTVLALLIVLPALALPAASIVVQSYTHINAHSSVSSIERQAKPDLSIPVQVHTVQGPSEAQWGRVIVMTSCHLATIVVMALILKQGLVRRRRHLGTDDD